MLNIVQADSRVFVTWLWHLMLLVVGWQQGVCDMTVTPDVACCAGQRQAVCVWLRHSDLGGARTRHCPTERHVSTKLQFQHLPVQTGSVACCQGKVQALGKGEGVCSCLHFESLVSSSSRIYWDHKNVFVKKWIVVRSHSTLVKQIYDFAAQNQFQLGKCVLKCKVNVMALPSLLARVHFWFS